MIPRAELDGLHDHGGSVVLWKDVALLAATAQFPYDRALWESPGWWQFQTRTDHWVWVEHRWWRMQSLRRVLCAVLPGFDPARMQFPRATRDDGATLVIWCRSDLRCPRCATPLVERDDPTWALLRVCPVDGHELPLGRQRVVRRQ